MSIRIENLKYLMAISKNTFFIEIKVNIDNLEFPIYMYWNF